MKINKHYLISSSLKPTELEDFLKKCTVSTTGDLSYFYKGDKVKVTNLDDLNEFYLEEIKKYVLSKLGDFNPGEENLRVTSTGFNLIYGGEKTNLVIPNIKKTYTYLYSTSWTDRLVSWFDPKTKKNLDKLISEVANKVLHKMIGSYLNYVFDFSRFIAYVVETKKTKKIQAKSFSAHVKKLKEKGVYDLYFNLKKRNLEDVYEEIYQNL